MTKHIEPIVLGLMLFGIFAALFAHAMEAKVDEPDVTVMQRSDVPKVDDTEVEWEPASTIPTVMVYGSEYHLKSGTLVKMTWGDRQAPEKAEDITVCYAPGVRIVPMADCDG